MSTISKWHDEEGAQRINPKRGSLSGRGGAASHQGDREKDVYCLQSKESWFLEALLKLALITNHQSELKSQGFSTLLGIICSSWK